MSVAAWLRAGLLTLCKATEGLAAIILALLVMVNLLAVTFRYGLNEPLVWTEETLRYLMVWVAMAGAAAALLRDEHMAVDLPGLFAGPRVRRLARAVTLLFVLAFALVVLWFAAPMAERNAAQVSPAARIPMVWPYLALVVGAAGLAINALGGLVLLALGEEPSIPDADPRTLEAHGPAGPREDQS